MKPYVAILVLALAGCSGAAVADSSGPVSRLLDAVDRESYTEFQVLDIANAICVRLDQGANLKDAEAEWVDAGWNDAVVTAVGDQLTRDPGYCGEVLPRLVVSERAVG